MKTRFSTPAHSLRLGAAALGVALVVTCLPAGAQSTYGTFLGTVTDATGAAVPDAQVTARNQATEYSLLGLDASYYGTYAPTSTTPVLTLSNIFSGTPGVSSFPGYRRANQWDLRDPRVYQWNVTFDRDIGFQTVLRLSYVGSHTVDLIYSPDFNQVVPNTASYTDPSTGKTVYGYAALTATPALRQQNLKYPNFAEVLTRNNGPSDRYNAFIVEVNRALRAGAELFQQLHPGMEQDQCAGHGSDLGHSHRRARRQRR